MLYHTLNLSRSTDFPHILSLGNREAVLKAQRFSSLIQCNHVIPKGRKCKPGEKSKRKFMDLKYKETFTHLKDKFKHLKYKVIFKYYLKYKVSYSIKKEIFST